MSDHKAFIPGQKSLAPGEKIIAPGEKTITNDSGHKMLWWILGFGLLLGALLAGEAGSFLVRNTGAGQSIARVIGWLFALNSTQTTWYITRAAGWISYFLLWFSMIWGLAIPTKFFERVISPTFAVDFHEYISLLSLGFIVLHVGSLLFDKYLPFTLSQVLIPFTSSYRPIWVGLGIVGFYLSALVTITFYLRKRIGQKRFKSIHTVSVFAYLGVILHAFFGGSDSSLGAVQLIYLSTFLVVLFLTSYWLLRGRGTKTQKNERTLISKHAPAIKR